MFSVGCLEPGCKGLGFKIILSVVHVIRFIQCASTDKEGEEKKRKREKKPWSQTNAPAGSRTPAPCYLQKKSVGRLLALQLDEFRRWWSVISESGRENGRLTQAQGGEQMKELNAPVENRTPAPCNGRFIEENTYKAPDTGLREKTKITKSADDGVECTGRESNPCTLLSSEIRGGEGREGERQEERTKKGKARKKVCADNSTSTFQLCSGSVCQTLDKSVPTLPVLSTWFAGQLSTMVAFTPWGWLRSGEEKRKRKEALNSD
uniref:Uncharacterized protein n=1 Tax=Mycena maculata TaxID=230809 RepID=A0AAD7N924_9AGAR|nr:hypothetical protein DFH07DRAFT_775294 [Mycena maculata]